MKPEETGDKQQVEAARKVENIVQEPAPPDEAVSAEESRAPGFFEVFQNALNRARREHQPVSSRKELSRDKTKSMFLLAGVAVALLLVFLGVFSSPKKTILPSERRSGPNLGRKVTPGQESSAEGRSATPMLSADLQPGETGPGNPG